MNIEAHKKAKPRHKGKDVRNHYDLKRERERAAAEGMRLRERVDATAAAQAASARPKRSRRMAAE